MASTARGLAPGTATARPSARTSSGPRIRNSTQLCAHRIRALRSLHSLRRLQRADSCCQRAATVAQGRPGIVVAHRPTAPQGAAS